MNDNKELTYGQKAVGITFNPSGNEKVDKIKGLYAEIIDLLYEERIKSDSSERARHLSIGITDAEAAVMRAVKGITFPY